MKKFKDMKEDYVFVYGMLVSLFIILFLKIILKEITYTVIIGGFGVIFLFYFTIILPQHFEGRQDEKPKK